MAKSHESDDLRSLLAESTHEEPVFAFELVCRNGNPGHSDNCSHYGEPVQVVTPYFRDDIHCEGCDERMLPLHGAILTDDTVTSIDNPDGEALHDGLHPQYKRDLEMVPRAEATGGYCHRDDCPGLIAWDMASLILNRSHTYCSPRCAKEAVEELDEEITEVCLHDPQGHADRVGIRSDRQNSTNIWRYVVNHQEALSAIASFRERLPGPFRVIPDDELREINKNRDL